MKTVRVAGARQQALLASSVRQNLLDTLCAAGPSSARALAGEAGMRPSAIYYHLELLERAGLVARVRPRSGQGRQEAVFRAAATRIAVDHDLRTPRGRRASSRIARALLRAAARDFDAGLRSPAARTRSPGRNLWASRSKAWLSDDEIASIDRHLASIEEILLGARRGPGRTLCAASWVLAPLEAR